MPVTMSDAYKEALTYVPSDDLLVRTLSIEHPDRENVYLVQGYANYSGTLENSSTVVLFVPGHFDLKPPTKSNNGVPDISFTIGNADGAASEYLEAVKASGKPTELVHREYLDSDPSAPVSFIRFQVHTVNATRLQVTGRAVFARDLKNTRIPKERYTRTRFPGLG